MLINCTVCGKEKNKKPCEIRKTKKNFCSRSCAASYNNRLYPKRQPQKNVLYCIDCKKMCHGLRCRKCHIKYKKSNKKEIYYRNTCKCGKPCYGKVCFLCYNPSIHNPPLPIKDMALFEVISKYSKHHRASVYTLIRSRARAIAKKMGWDSCKNCGYNKHIEVCHIKAVSDFSDDTLISVINDPSNLIPLCPNCHWEFDNGMLKL